MYIGFHVKYPLFFSEFVETFATDLRRGKTYANIKFRENSSSGSRVVSC